MRPVPITRRGVLLGAGTATAAVLAGCLGDDEAESLPAYADWVPDEASAEVLVLSVRRSARASILRQSHTSLAARASFWTATTALGVEGEEVPPVLFESGTVEASLNLGSGSGEGPNPDKDFVGAVATGTFDPDRLATRLTEDWGLPAVGREDGYDRYGEGGLIAVSETAVVTGSRPETAAAMREADAGGGLLVDTNDDFGAVVRRAGSADSVVVELPRNVDPSDPLATAQTVSYRDDADERGVYRLFTDRATASEQEPAIRDEFEDADSGTDGASLEEFDVRVDGRLVVVEYSLTGESGSADGDE